VFESAAVARGNVRDVNRPVEQRRACTPAQPRPVGTCCSAVQIWWPTPSTSFCVTTARCRSRIASPPPTSTYGGSTSGRANWSILRGLGEPRSSQVRPTRHRRRHPRRERHVALATECTTASAHIGESRRRRRTERRCFGGPRAFVWRMTPRPCGELTTFSFVPANTAVMTGSQGSRP